MKTILLLTLLAAAGFAGESSEIDSNLIYSAIKGDGGKVPSIEYGNANLYIDLVLFNINRQLPDVIPLPFVPPGPFNLDNCYFIGLENHIKRDGDATLVVSENNARFTMGLRMEDFGVVCDWKYLLSSGTATVKSSFMSMDAGMIWVIESGQHPYLTQLIVTEMAPFKSEISGIWGINWMIEMIVDSFLEGIEDIITSVIENQVKALMQAALNNMVIP